MTDMMIAHFKKHLPQDCAYYALMVLSLATIFFSYLFNGPYTETMDGTGWIYFTTSCLTHASLLLLPVLLLVHFPLSLLGANKWVKGTTLSLIYSLTMLLAIVNKYVFDIYHFHINEMIVRMLTCPGASEIFVFPTAMYVKSALIVVGVVLFCHAVYFFSTWLVAHRCRKGCGRHALLALLGCGLISQSLHIYGAATMHTSVIETTAVVPYYFPLRMNSLLTRWGIIDEQRTNLIQFKNGTNKINYPLRKLEMSRPDSLLNVVVLCIDAWNPRTMTPECTPNIWRFAEQAEHYTQHLSSGNGTRQGIFGLFTGLSAYYWNAFELSNQQPLLITELLRAGYKVQAYPSATLAYPPFAKMIFGDVPSLNVSTPGNTPYERDCRITKNFIADLERQDGKRPFFSFVFYDAAHAIEVPKERQGRFQPSWEESDYMPLSNETDPTPFFNLYRNCVYQIDSLIGQTLQKLREKKLLERTVVIITGDHGQEFNENHNNYWGHSSNFSRHQLGIPLVYYYPGCQPARRNYRTTHYDISPTLLHDVLGVRNAPSDYSMGKFLHDASPRDWHLVGSDIANAFILSDGTIIEKQGTGRLKVMNPQMREIPHYRFHAKSLNDAITSMNRFFKP